MALQLGLTPIRDVLAVRHDHAVKVRRVACFLVQGSVSACSVLTTARVV